MRSTMPGSDDSQARGRDVFFDSSALIAGVISPTGAARALLQLSENESIRIVVSEQVIVEVERNISRKVPQALVYTRETLQHANLRIVRDPTIEDVHRHRDWISHLADVPILVAAKLAKVHYLVTLNTRHFIDDPEVARRSGLRIGTPADALAWIRGLLSEQ